MIPTDLVGLILLIVVLILLWIIVSIPAYLAGKMVTGGKSTLGEAMAATVLGPIVYIAVRFGIDFFLAGVLGGTAVIIGYILAFLAWILGLQKCIQDRLAWGHCNCDSGRNSVRDIQLDGDRDSRFLFHTILANTDKSLRNQ